MITVELNSPRLPELLMRSIAAELASQTNAERDEW
jgi:hypothetical protein